MPPWKGLSVMIGAVALTMGGTASARERVIYDNDWSVTNGGYVSQPSLMILLTDPNIDVIGLTAVSGDFWRDEGMASLLRFLEIVGATKVPVHAGAVHPLVNSAERHAMWERRYGKVYWSGAWNDAGRDPTAHARTPYRITPPREGMPRKLKASERGAVAFMIDAVRRHPHEVTIYAEGPLTNIALAMRKDPAFADLARRIVVQGGSVGSDHDDGSKPAEFNFLFDPEAADIVLRGSWHEMLLVGDVSNRTVMTDAIRKRIAAIDTPAGRYATTNISIALPLWSQTGAAIIADPSLIAGSVSTVVQVDVGHGSRYGRTRSRPLGPMVAVRSAPGAVTLVTQVDGPRLIDAYVRSLAKPIDQPASR